MKLLSYVQDDVGTWGVLTDAGAVGREHLGDALPSALAGLMAACEQHPTLARDVRDRAEAARARAASLEGLHLLPCIPQPGKVICLGVNYVDHAKEGGNTVADYPALFLRCSTSLLAHGAPLKVPSISSSLDFEAELAVVIGRRTRFVSEADALEAVFGYACFNDATLRDYQRRTTQWTIGNNFDATGGFGPCLVTADELPPGGAGLRIESRLNGRVMQSANTSDMVFGVARTIALLSEAVTLEPGDVVVMGTPAGVGYARTPAVWMKAGDVIEVEIERVGVLRNPVVA